MRRADDRSVEPDRAHVAEEVRVAIRERAPLGREEPVVMNVTVKPIDDVAVTLSGPWSSRRSSIGANVIVWGPLATLKLCATGGAAA
jgi:hypothetical protein